MRKLLNWFAYAVIAFLLVSKVPTFYHNFKLQDTAAAQMSVKKLSGETIALPAPGQKSVLVFWATWCGPCRVELGRLNDMVKDNAIMPEQIIAINIQESIETIQDYLKSHPYEFTIALDESGAASQFFDVKGTPTVVFLDDQGKINWITTGLSPFLSFRIKSFLKN